MQKEIREILYRLDPMNTSCKENGLLDEYDHEAIMLLSSFAALHSFKKQGVMKDIVKNVFEYTFWEDCLNEQQLKEIEDEISKLDGVYPTRS